MTNCNVLKLVKVAFPSVAISLLMGTVSQAAIEWRPRPQLYSKCPFASDKAVPTASRRVKQEISQEGLRVQSFPLPSPVYVNVIYYTCYYPVEVTESDDYCPSWETRLSQCGESSYGDCEVLRTAVDEQCGKVDLQSLTLSDCDSYKPLHPIEAADWEKSEAEYKRRFYAFVGDDLERMKTAFHDPWVNEPLSNFDKKYGREDGMPVGMSKVCEQLDK